MAADRRLERARPLAPSFSTLGLVFDPERGDIRPGTDLDDSIDAVVRRVLADSDRSVPIDLSGGGDDGTRTHDPLLAKQVLFQLSYVPEKAILPAVRSAPRPILVLRSPSRAPIERIALGVVTFGPGPWV